MVQSRWTDGASQPIEKQSLSIADVLSAEVNMRSRSVHLSNPGVITIDQRSHHAKGMQKRENFRGRWYRHFSEAKVERDFLIVAKISWKYRPAFRSSTTIPLSWKKWWCISQLEHFLRERSSNNSWRTFWACAVLISDTMASHCPGIRHIEQLLPIISLSGHRSYHFWSWHTKAATNLEKELLHINREGEQPFL